MARDKCSLCMVFDILQTSLQNVFVLLCDCVLAFRQFLFRRICFVLVVVTVYTDAYKTASRESEATSMLPIFPCCKMTGNKHFVVNEKFIRQCTSSFRSYSLELLVANFDGKVLIGFK